MNIALIIAGGSGKRMGQDIPKQFLTINEKPVIIYTLEAFQSHADIDEIAVVCIANWENVLKAYAKQFNITKLHHVIVGGDCGQSSIRNGVFALEKQYSQDDIVLIHDAIRPLVSHEIISDCISKVQEYGNAISAVPCAEAMLETSDGVFSTSSYARDKLKRTQTPQGFRLGKICDLHHRALEMGITNSIASCTLMVQLGNKVYFSAGSEKNIKLTTTDDIDIFRALLMTKKYEWLK